MKSGVQIATRNVDSIRARRRCVLTWLAVQRPAILRAPVIASVAQGGTAHP